MYVKAIIGNYFIDLICDVQWPIVCDHMIQTGFDAAVEIN